jgi:hypothetical protein
MIDATRSQKCAASARLPRATKKNASRRIQINASFSRPLNYQSSHSLIVSHPFPPHRAELCLRYGLLVAATGSLMYYLDARFSIDLTVQRWHGTNLAVGGASVQQIWQKACLGQLTASCMRKYRYRYHIQYFISLSFTYAVLILLALKSRTLCGSKQGMLLNEEMKPFLMR